MKRTLLLTGIISIACNLAAINSTSRADFNLGVTLSGSAGSVNSSPSGIISCTHPPQTGTCSSLQANNTSVTLMATPDINSFFGGWSGSCSGCFDFNCKLVLDSNKNCNATFTTLPPVMVEGPPSAYHSILQNACDSVQGDLTIKARDIAFPETLAINHIGTVNLKCGYDSTFNSQTGFSTLNGNLIINKGPLVADRLIISTTIIPPPDTQPPTVPANLKATAAGTDRINLTWEASTDNTAVTGYEIYRGGIKIGTSSATSYSDSGLPPSTYNCYSVLAHDTLGNKSAQSVQSCATTTGTTTAAKVALDSTGTVQTTVSVSGPGGSTLTLYAGTRVVLISNGIINPLPANLENVYLSLINSGETLPPLQNGVIQLIQLRIVLTIDNIEREASFWPASGAATEQGLKLLAVVANQNISNGTMGMLFDTVSGKAVKVASSAVTMTGAGGAGSSSGSPASGAASGTGTGQMQFNMNHTGSYSVGGSSPGAGSSPAGAFWSSFTIADPGCVPVGNVQVCGPSRVDRIEITEESTADILGMCSFGESNTASTGVIPPGYQFWCERIPGAGGSTEIRVSSMQANFPIIHAYLVLVSDGLPMWETYTNASGGLNGPGGAVYPDPYQKKEFEFAGFKKLTFVTTANKDYNWMRQHALQPLRNAGYTANLHSFSSTSPGFIAEIGVYDTLDARVLIEDNVILKEPWKVRSGDTTKGNRGTYDYTPRYRGTTKATATFPIMGYKVWEITGDVTFEKDPNYSNEQYDVYTTSAGTITQTQYTVPVPNGCYGVPASFTNTYPIFKGDGYLSIVKNSDPVQYIVSASVSPNTPVEPHNYQECCSFMNPPCEDKIMQANEQEHEWLRSGTGQELKTGQSGGFLTGTYSFPPYGTPSYEWTLTPVDE